MAKKSRVKDRRMREQEKNEVLLKQNTLKHL